MAVKTYDLNRGNPHLTENLLASEFRSPGETLVIIEEKIPLHIQALKDDVFNYWGRRVKYIKINAGHRTPAYNSSVGGAKNSPHIGGHAADFYFSDEATGRAMPSIYILCAAQLRGILGIERIRDGFSVHIDEGFRSKPWWTYQAVNANGAFVYNPVSDFFKSAWANTEGITVPTGFKPVVPQAPEGWVKRLQIAINTNKPQPKLLEDNIPGPRTLAACPTLRIGAEGVIVLLLRERIENKAGKIADSAASDTGASVAGATNAGAASTGVWDEQLDKKFYEWQEANSKYVGKADRVCGPMCWKRLLGLS